MDLIHIGRVVKRMIAIIGEAASGEANIKSRNWIIKELPDFPSLEPIPSIADFPLILFTGDRGMKAISLVSSKTVYLEALLNIF